MKVLVTGASGFVGSSLCDALSREGHQVMALMRRTSSSANLGAAKVSPVYGDLRDEKSLHQAVSEAEWIFHVAGLVTAKSREEYFASNAEGTGNLIRAAEAAASCLKRFVYVSSLAAAGPSLPETPKREEDPPEPVSYYGASKFGGEEAVRDSRLPWVVVRPPAVYGPRDRGMLEFFKLVNAGVRLGLSGGDRRRYSFIHVDDLVRGTIQAAAEARAERQVYFLAGDEDATWDEAMEMIARALEKKTFRLPLPLVLLRGMGALYSGISMVTGKALPMSLDKVKELEAASWTCSNAKAKQELRFQPRWAVKDGLRETARWYKEQRWL